MDRIKAFIDGRYENSDRKFLIKINPVSGVPIARVEKTDNALKKTIQGAKIAQSEWCSITGKGCMCRKQFSRCPMWRRGVFIFWLTRGNNDW